MNELEELKYALDVTWHKHPEFADILGTKVEYYKIALKRIEEYIINNTDKSLDVISSKDDNGNRLRDKIKQHAMDPNYLNKLYRISMINKAEYLNYVPSNEEMVNEILEKMNYLENQSKKRSFFEESKMIDETINKVNSKYRKEFFHNAFYNNTNFNIHYKKSDLEFISSLDKDSIKLLLTDNAYRIYTIINSRTLPENIDMLSDNGNIEEYRYYSSNLNNVMENINDISMFVSEMDDNMLSFLTNIYCMSLKVRNKNSYILESAGKINDPKIKHQIFEQLEDKDTLTKIKENKRGYSI